MHAKLPHPRSLWEWLLYFLILALFVYPTVYFLVLPTIEKWRASRPGNQLAKADAYRGQMTTASLRDALETYQAIRAASKPSSTTRLKAEIGISRTYSDFAWLNYWMGFPRGTYTSAAVGAALDALRTRDLAQAHSFDAAIGIALAYAYESIEADSDTKPLTLHKIAELQSGAPNDREVRYLTWLTKGSAEGRASFWDETDPKTLSEIRILVDVANDYVLRGEAVAVNGNGQHERGVILSRARVFLDRASQLGADHPVVIFRERSNSASLDFGSEPTNWVRSVLRKLTRLSHMIQLGCFNPSSGPTAT